MTSTTKNQATASPQYHPEFGRIRADVDLGIAILIAETEDGLYDVLGPVATINEACEIASVDMVRRMKSLENGGEPTCPAIYKVWSRNRNGDYSISYERDAMMKPAAHGTQRVIE